MDNIWTKIDQLISNALNQIANNGWLQLVLLVMALLSIISYIRSRQKQKDIKNVMDSGNIRRNSIASGLLGGGGILGGIEFLNGLSKDAWDIPTIITLALFIVAFLFLGLFKFIYASYETAEKVHPKILSNLHKIFFWGFTSFLLAISAFAYRFSWQIALFTFAVGSLVIIINYFFATKIDVDTTNEELAERQRAYRAAKKAKE